MKILNNDTLPDITRYWKDELGLQDWHIKVSICRANEMILKEVGGENEYQHDNKIALIRLLDPVDYGDRVIEQDHEITLVHELLHCVFSPIDTEDVIADRIQHQIICSLSKALVSAKRCIPKETIKEGE